MNPRRPSPTFMGYYATTRFLSVLAMSAAIFFAAGCAVGPPLAPPVTSSMVAASGGTSPVVLNRGLQIFAGPCSACHAPEPVARYTLSEWRQIVGDMAARTKLDASGRQALIDYLEAAKAMEAATVVR